MKNRILVISPSGNLYGSEQVLCDYLMSTRHLLDVCVPEGSRLADVLGSSSHRLLSFRSVRILYLSLIAQLLTRRYDVVYVNEGGHSRYILVLARLFRRVKFVVHVRILEDTQVSRWAKQMPGNVQLVSISDFVRNALAHPSQLVYDLYRFPKVLPDSFADQSGAMQVAVIGRLSKSKGFEELVKLALFLNHGGNRENIILNIYGHVSAEVSNHGDLQILKGLHFVRFHGFVNNKDIYKCNQVVLHLSKAEPLGRIYFEALSAGLPLVGFNAGGIGEIGSKIGLVDHLVEPGENESSALVSRIVEVSKKSELRDKLLKGAMERARNIYSVEEYVRVMDKLLAPEI